MMHVRPMSARNIVDLLLSLFVCTHAAPEKGDAGITYKLVGVSNHSGGLGGGHYTAYVITCDHGVLGAIEVLVRSGGCTCFFGCCDDNACTDCMRTPVHSYARVMFHGGWSVRRDCCNADDERWHNFNDSRVSAARPDGYDESAAYLLFFQRC